MAITFVSAYLNLSESRPDDKPLSRCLEHFKNIADTDIPLHLFLSPEFIPLYHEQIGTRKNITVEPIRLSDLDTYKELQSINYSLPANRHATHDSAAFLTLMNAKVELVRRVITSGRYTTSHYAWIDFSIFHVFKDIQGSKTTLKTIAGATPVTPILAIPGCWQKGQHAETLFSAVNWRFSGGFFLGDAQSLLDWERAYRTHFANITRENGVLVWEANIWHTFELRGHIATQWYQGDHNDKMIKIPTTFFKHYPYSPPSVVPSTSNTSIYWDGPNSRCHVGKDIHQYIETSAKAHDIAATVIVGATDGVLCTKEYERMRNTPGIKGLNNVGEAQYAEWESLGRVGTYPVIGVLCSRKFSRPNMLHLPFDDEVFRDGLDAMMKRQGVVQIPWEQKCGAAVWRGGTSGVDRPLLRHRVVQALYGVPYANVALTPNGWPENNANIPQQLFGGHMSPAEQANYKYILSIDGACIASNLMWVFGSGSVPIIITHPENNFWFKKFLKPMVNYVPVDYSLSDLHEKILWLLQNDARAKEIASAAYALSQEIFTPTFQRAYIDSELTAILNRRYNRIGFDTVYARKCYTPGDIHQHLPVLREYSAKCNRIVECGVCNSVSSYAFATALVGKPDNFYYLVDPYRNSAMDEFLAACAREGVHAEFHHGSDLTCPRVEADLVFIDTWHIYAQLKRELEYWHTYAKQYIIMHDTTVDEWDGESIRGRFDLEKQSRESGWPVSEIGKGLWPAIEEFLGAHSEWELDCRLVNNNGLTILRRK